MSEEITAAMEKIKELGEKIRPLCEKYDGPTAISALMSVAAQFIMRNSEGDVLGAMLSAMSAGMTMAEVIASKAIEIRDEKDDQEG